MATYYGHLAVVQMLLEYGANLNTVTEKLGNIVIARMGGGGSQSTCPPPKVYKLVHVRAGLAHVVRRKGGRLIQLSHQTTHTRAHTHTRTHAHPFNFNLMPAHAGQFCLTPATCSLKVGVHCFLLQSWEIWIW